MRGVQGFPPPSGDALIGDVATGKKFSSQAAGFGKIGTAAGIAGNAVAADVAAGKTFSSSAAGSNITGTQPIPALFAPTTRFNASTTMTAVKKMTVNFTGTVRIFFTGWNDGAGYSAIGRIYKNGVAFGTQRGMPSNASAAVTYIEDLSCVAGDYFELFIANGGGSAYNAIISNFIILPVSVLSIGGLVNTD